MARTSRVNWHNFDVNYSRKLSPYRSWKRWLSVGCAAIAVGWIGWSAIHKDTSIYSSGPMSMSHQSLAAKCGDCHTDAWQGLKVTADKDRAMNAACLTCHAKTIGHDPNAMTAWHQRSGDAHRQLRESKLSCSSCHVEHEGPRRLAAMNDQKCIQCHGDLKKELPATKFVTAIHAFDQDHPQFRILATKFSDTAKVNFNHKRHMHPDGPPWNEPGLLLSKVTNLSASQPARRFAKLACDDCHRADNSETPFKYANPSLRKAKQETSASGAYMQPIRYELHCAACHALTVADHADELAGFGSQGGVAAGAVPHDTPELIRTYLLGQLTQFVNSLKEDELPAARKQDADLRAIFVNTKPPEERERSKMRWIIREIAAIERHLYAQPEQQCRKCHAFGPEAGGFPTIVPTQIPDRWFHQAEFNHRKHRDAVKDCQECHLGAADSINTSDVLLKPGITQCQTCHGPATKRAGIDSGGVASDCVTCHIYHPARGKEPRS